MIIEENYREHEAISNSDLKLLKRPRDFYDIKYGDKEREEKKAFHLGTLLDLKCFNPEKIKEDYILCDVEAPTNAYHVEYVENRLAGMSPVEAYSAKYSTKGKSDEKIAKEAGDLEKKYKDYLEMKKLAEDKIEYTPDDDYAVNQMKLSILGHQLASQLILAESGGEGVHIYTHLALNFKLGEIDAKGELDRLIIDTKNKTIKVIDLKTTGTPVYSFGYSAKKYSYPRQLVIYGEAATQFALNEGFIENKNDISDWSFEYLIVAVEKSAPFECRVFNVPRVALIEAIDELNELLDQYMWHKENDKWDHMPEYYKNEGLEELDYRPDPNNVLDKMMGNIHAQRQAANVQGESREANKQELV